MHEDERKLRVDVLPRWGARRVGEIRRADVIDAAARGEEGRSNVLHLA